MKELALCCCAALALFSVSCAPSTRPEMPADQANKMRQHRLTASEDTEENGRTKEGTPLPPANESSWKF